LDAELSGLDTGRMLRIVRIGAFIAFTAVGAQLAVRLPFTPVPVTMQTLFVVMAGIVLGPRDAFTALLTYLALGAAGLPIFAGFSFGPAVLAGPTGGYLIAFPAAALLCGYLHRSLGRGRIAAFLSMTAGTALILLIGTAHFSLITGISPGGALSLAVTPFIGAELVKVTIGTILSGKKLAD